MTNNSKKSRVCAPSDLYDVSDLPVVTIEEIDDAKATDGNGQGQREKLNGCRSRLARGATMTRAACAPDAPEASADRR